MGRSVCLIVLLLILAVCMGVIISAHAVANHSGLDPDVTENINVGVNYLLVASWTFLAALIARLINLVKISKEIILGFFFYSWRNSIYGKTYQILLSPFSGLETETMF
jgi:hypothetical protein